MADIPYLDYAESNCRHSLNNLKPEHVKALKQCLYKERNNLASLIRNHQGERNEISRVIGDQYLTISLLYKVFESVTQNQKP